jgi:hypothetical protein
MSSRRGIIIFSSRHNGVRHSLLRIDSHSLLCIDSHSLLRIDSHSLLIDRCLYRLNGVRHRLLRIDSLRLLIDRCLCRSNIGPLCDIFIRLRLGHNIGYRFCSLLSLFICFA